MSFAQGQPMPEPEMIDLPSGRVSMEWAKESAAAAERGRKQIENGEYITLDDLKSILNIDKP